VIFSGEKSVENGLKVATHSAWSIQNTGLKNYAQQLFKTAVQLACIEGSEVKRTTKETGIQWLEVATYI